MIPLKDRTIQMAPSRKAVTGDISDLCDWLRQRLSNEQLAKNISERNGIEPELTSNEAVQLAHKLGYWEFDATPDWLEKQMFKYEITKTHGF